MKKTLALLLALMMIFALAAPVMADNDGKIIIDPAVNDVDYTIYRIFDLKYNETTDSHAYTVNSAWADFINSDVAKAYVSVNSGGNVSWVEGASVADFAAAALKYAEDNNITPTAGPVKAENGRVEFSGLELGYYLVKSSLGTVCSLTSTDKVAEIHEKNTGGSTNEKYVIDGVQKDFRGKENTKDIGDKVEFQSVITVKEAEPTGYVLHDKMCEGLTFNNDVSITVGKDKVLAAGTDYTVVTSCADGCTFEVNFADGVLKTNDIVTVAYSARLNEKAVIGPEGNPNQSRLEYGEDKYTDWSETKTYTGEINIFKYTTDADGNEIPLAGAAFEVKRGSSRPITKLSFVLIEQGDETKASVYRVANDGDENVVTEVVSPASGLIKIIGLSGSDGTLQGLMHYRITETVAPEGYNKMLGYKDFIINEYGKTTSGVVEGTNIVKILNNTGAELPSTGGIGTTIFYIVGGLLMVGAAVVLVTRKKVNADK